MPILRLVFTMPISQTHAELVWLARKLGVRASTNTGRNDIIRRIAGNICQGESEDDRIAFLALVESNLSITDKKFKIDPLSEACFENLHPDDKNEFKRAGEWVEKEAKKRKVANWHREDNERNATRAKAKAKAKAKAAAAAPAGPAAGGGAAAGASTAGRGPSNMPDRQQRTHHGTDGLSFVWGSENENSSFHFLFTQLKAQNRGAFGWKVICKFHEGEATSSSSATMRTCPCSRSCTAESMLQLGC